MLLLLLLFRLCDIIMIMLIKDTTRRTKIIIHFVLVITIGTAIVGTGTGPGTVSSSVVFVGGTNERLFSCTC